MINKIEIIMGNYKITKVYETYYDAYVEADSLEEALKVSEYAETEWEEDLDYRPCIKGYWAMIDEEGEAEDAGELTPEQLNYLQR